MFVIQFGHPTAALTFMRKSDFSATAFADRPHGQSLVIFQDVLPLPVSQPCGYTLATVQLPADWVAVRGVIHDAAEPIRIHTLGKDVPEQGVWLTAGRPERSVMKSIRRLYEYAAANSQYYYKPKFRQAASRFGGHGND